MITMKQNIRVVDPKIEQQCEVFSKCNVLLVNKLGGIGDILCARVLFEDLKQVPKIGQTVFAVPRKYLPLIEDHSYIDRKLAVEDLTTEFYKDFAFVKDITTTPDDLEFNVKPNVTKNRADIYADSIGITLKSYDGHFVSTSKEIKFAESFMKQIGKGKKVGIAPFTSHVSKDLGMQLIEDLVFWCRNKKVIPLIFHDKKINIGGVETISDLSLRQWMAVVSLLDVVVTASTAMFWASQFTNRPTIVIAGFEDAHIFGKYHSNLVSIQRRAKGCRKLYSTIVRKQTKIEKFEGDWLYCPCWDAQKCAFKKWGEYPLFCLESVKINEVTEPLDTMLRGDRSYVQLTVNNKIAFVREGGLGDILMTIPIVKVLSKDRKIDYFTDPQYFPLLKDVNCNVKPVQDFDKNGYDKTFDLRSQLENYSLQLNRQHRVNAIADFCKVKLNNYSISLSTTKSDWAKRWLKNQKCKSKILIGICVRSAFRLRSWIETGPRDIVELLPSSINYILFGTNDWYNWKHPRVHAPVDLTIEQLVALIDKCSAIITTDNGLLHIAGALQVPMVALFGSLPPETRVKYYKNIITIVPDNVPCSPCWEWQRGEREALSSCINIDVQCMRAIKPQMVANALRKLLKGI